MQYIACIFMVVLVAATPCREHSMYDSVPLTFDILVTLHISVTEAAEGKLGVFRLTLSETEIRHD